MDSMNRVLAEQKETFACAVCECVKHYETAGEAEAEGWARVQGGGQLLCGRCVARGRQLLGGDGSRKQRRAHASANRRAAKHAARPATVR